MLGHYIINYNAERKPASYVIKIKRLNTIKSDKYYDYSTRMLRVTVVQW